MTRNERRKKKYHYMMDFVQNDKIARQARDWGWDTIKKYVRVRNFYQDHQLANKARKERSWKQITRKYHVTKPKDMSRVKPKKYTEKTKRRRLYRKEIWMLQEIGRLSPQQARKWMKKPATFRKKMHTKILNERGLMTHSAWRLFSNENMGFPRPMEEVAQNLNDERGLEVHDHYGWTYLYWRWVKGKTDEETRREILPGSHMGVIYAIDMMV